MCCRAGAPQGRDGPAVSVQGPLQHARVGAGRAGGHPAPWPRCGPSSGPRSGRFKCAQAVGSPRSALPCLPVSLWLWYCRRYCFKIKDEDRPAFCMCDRGFTGEACEAEVNTCYKGCSGERRLGVCMRGRAWRSQPAGCRLDHLFRQKLTCF